MEKTYTQNVHFKVIIEGDYSCCNLLYEELFQNAEECNDAVWNHVDDNIKDYFYNTDIILTNLRTSEDCCSDGRDDYHCHGEPAPQSTGGMMVRKIIQNYERMIEEHEKGR